MLKITVRAFAAAVILGVQPASARRLNSACSAAAVSVLLRGKARNNIRNFIAPIQKKYFGNL